MPDTGRETTILISMSHVYRQPRCVSRAQEGTARRGEPIIPASNETLLHLQ